MREWNLKEAIAMWNKGSTSMQIALHFNVTRNVVIGRIKRARDKGDMYVALKPSFKKSSKTKEVKDKIVYPKPKLQLIQEEKPVEEGLLIYELKPGQCKYGISYNSKGQHLFCGKHTDGNYCEEHHKICHTRPEKKESIPLKDYKKKFLRFRY